MPLYSDDDEHMRVTMARNIVAVQIAVGQQFTNDRLLNIVRHLWNDQNNIVKHTIHAVLNQFAAKLFQDALLTFIQAHHWFR